MQLFKNTAINFVNKTKYAIIISCIFIICGIMSLLYHGGPALSIDFTGGQVIQLTVAEKLIDITAVRSALIDYGINGSEILEVEDSNSKGKHTIEIKIPPPKSKTTDIDEYHNNINQLLKEVIGSFEIESEDWIGPKVGDELKDDAINAILIALILITIYVSFRFDRFYAYGSLAALIHDILITLGIFSILDIEISLKIIAAFLTILGYSLNDTIVVFDRLREMKDKLSGEPIDDIINKSLNMTLGRTVITSFTTLIAVTSLFIWGGPELEPFAFALIIGVIVGTYSSIFVASPVMKYFESRKESLDEDTNLHQND